MQNRRYERYGYFISYIYFRFLAILTILCDVESLKAIAENIHVTMEINGFEIPYLVGNLEKLSSKPLKVGHMEIPALWHGFPRNASEGQLSAFKQAGN